MTRIDIIRQLSNHTFPRHSIIKICKSFIRPYLDYGDVVYDQPITFFCQQIGSIQYNASLAITEA